MSRQLDHLKQLIRELQQRYGSEDETVLQVKHELESREGLESAYPERPPCYRESLSSKAAQHRRDAIARNPVKTSRTRECA